MSEAFSGYKAILAATDFSPHGSSALKRAVWIAQQCCQRLVVASVVTDLRRAIHHTSYRSRIEFLEGNEEHFQRELRRDADQKLKQEIATLGDVGIDIKYETLLGEAYEELVHSVQQEGYDLVVAGTRGYGALTRFVMGSTAKHLVRQCPASVWIVKHEDAKPPTTILAATDLSDVSSRAIQQAAWLSKRAGASLHIAHVVESAGLSNDLLDRQVAGGQNKSVRTLIENEVTEQLRNFLAQQGNPRAQTHLLWGSAARETIRLAGELKADVIVMGTVGRRGLQGILLGNTAEEVLAHAECDVLAVKPADFVSSIRPATWPLHPGPAGK
jgi:nucleotide-binding universal stress UspA family protein